MTINSFGKKYIFFLNFIAIFIFRFIIKIEKKIQSNNKKKKQVVLWITIIFKMSLKKSKLSVKKSISKI